jgi:hypothetical protein
MKSLPEIYWGKGGRERIEKPPFANGMLFFV